MTAASPHLPGSEPKNAWLSEAERVDKAVYAAVAGTDTPRLDLAMRRLSRAADYSRLSITCGVVLALSGGARGRGAAVSGLASVAVTATIVNLVVKPLGRRHRPHRAAEDVPGARQVRMPTSRSFPSGHTATAVAFATGVARVIPGAGVPAHVLAALVAYSRVHTGVHYPGDVLGGALLGAMIGDLTAAAVATRRCGGASSGNDLGVLAHPSMSRS
ncbi:MAG TPA: phosphatase PAP2 family protein [Solirubrobacteraceae bacterium]|nr:phosphatase PAP2 family protein [Solirubrobacteraceae bacterium]